MTRFSFGYLAQKNDKKVWRHPWASQPKFYKTRTDIHTYTHTYTWTKIMTRFSFGFLAQKYQEYQNVPILCQNVNLPDFRRRRRQLEKFCQSWLNQLKPSGTEFENQFLCKLPARGTKDWATGLNGSLSGEACGGFTLDFKDT